MCMTKKTAPKGATLTPAAYTNRRLKEVSGILDDIASHTGFEYVVIQGRFLGELLAMGKFLSEGIKETAKMLNHRRELAAKYYEEKNNDHR